MKKFLKFIKKLGPGFITGASDDDPSGIGAYSQTGAQFGYSQLWTALFTFPFMTVVQEMCGRIGIVTGKGLAGVIKHHYSKSVLYISVFILLIANTVNIGADLGAMASSLKLVFGLPFSVWLLLITAVCLGLQIFVSYHLYVRVLKFLTFSLFAYVVTVFLIKQDLQVAFFATFIPNFSFDKAYIFNIVAILGTTISPYLFFWQAGEEVEEEVDKHELKAMGFGKPKFTLRDIKEMRIDTIAGMFFSNLVMFFIIMTTASTLNRSGITDVQTASQAAEALRPFAGDLAYLLFAVGIIGTGLLAVPVLAGSASYALAETFNWKEGLYRKFTQAHGFYGVITMATLVGLIINFLHIPSFTLLYYSAIFNGLCAPVLLVLIMLISNNKKIMGEYTNGALSNVLGWLITVIMIICALALLFSLF